MRLAAAAAARRAAERPRRLQVEAVAASEAPLRVEDPVQVAVARRRALLGALLVSLRHAPILQPVRQPVAVEVHVAFVPAPVPGHPKRIHHVAQDDPAAVREQLLRGFRGQRLEQIDLDCTAEKTFDAVDPGGQEVEPLARGLGAPKDAEVEGKLLPVRAREAGERAVLERAAKAVDRALRRGAELLPRLGVRLREVRLGGRGRLVVPW